jgi:nitrate/TMAO reductase-like tetraheme cytochrome c subunit
MSKLLRLVGKIICGLALLIPCSLLAQNAAHSYDDFNKPDYCGACHQEIYQEWRQSLMSQSFVHEWDETEYYDLALPHSGQLEKVAGVKAGCIGCHSPLAFLTGDIPPKRPAEKSRANEGVSCEICHNITGSTEEEPFNFSFTISPGNIKYGPRKNAEPGVHEAQYSAFTSSAKLCATCHDEQSPYGAWVKSTYREWKAGPYSSEGVQCQDCHMSRASGTAGMGGPERADVAHHVFHGSHSPSKLAGAVDLALYANKSEVSARQKLTVRAELFNGKVGHMIPSGSSEERMLWLEIQAVDSRGKTYPLILERKGFDGEEFTIADSKAKAYQLMGEIMGTSGFTGVSRDGNVPDGVRIFRKPFFDAKGRMTICQWGTADNEKIDYRIGPRETKIETFTWQAPTGIPSGGLKIEAKLWYSQVPTSVGEFLKLPAEEYAPILVNATDISLTAR